MGSVLMGSVSKGRGLKCVREISCCRFRVEQGQRLPAAKRRKSSAHGVSRGCKREMIQPPRGEREKFSLWIRFERARLQAAP
jgi:hypothetical protein